MNGEAGKGDTYRRVNRKAYNKGYLRAYGVTCPKCCGDDLMRGDCSLCDGYGLVDNLTRERYMKSVKSSPTTPCWDDEWDSLLDGTSDE